MIDFDHAETTGEIRRGSVHPQVPGHVHPLVQRVAVRKVDKVIEGVHVVHLPDHFVLLGVSSGPAHGEGYLGAVVQDGEPNGFGSGDDVEGVWGVSQLDPENLVIVVTIGLSQVLHRLDLYKQRSIYAPWKRKSELTIARVIPGLVPVEGSDGERGDTGKESRATDVGSDGVGHDFVAPGMLESADGLDGILKAPRESNNAFGMAPRHIEPAEETLLNLTLHGLVVGRIWDVRGDAASNSTPVSQNKKKEGVVLTWR